MIFFCLQTINIYAQCEADVGGFYYFCDPDNPGDFYVGFTVNGISGTYEIEDVANPTLDIISSSLMETLSTPSGNTFPGTGFTNPLTFSANDEYYFQIGPYSSGMNFNLQFSDTNNTACDIPIQNSTYTCNDMSGGCASAVPFYKLDFNNVNNNYLLLGRTRANGCCDVSGRCLEFEIEIGNGIAALEFELLGAPGGDIAFYNNTLNDYDCDFNDCGAPCVTIESQSMQEPLCITDEGTYIIFACKSGNNPQGVSISGVAPVSPPTISVSQSCVIDSVIVEGASNISWSSQEDQNLSNLMCMGMAVTDCDVPSFEYNVGEFGVINTCEPIEFYYRIEVTPELSDCNEVLVDSVYFKVYPNYTPSLEIQCSATAGMVDLNALIDDNSLDCDYYSYSWSNGSSSSSITVPTDGAEYCVIVGINDPDYDEMCLDTMCINVPTEIYSVDCSTLTDTIVLCDSDIPPPNSDLITYTTVCDDLPLIDSDDVNSVIGAGCLGDPTIIERTYTIDFDGDLLTTVDQFECVQNITIQDTIKPDFTVPSDITVECETDPVPTNTGDVTDAADNCSTAITMFSDAVEAGLCPNESVITRTWTVRDDCGNDSIAIQIITIEDNTNPEFDVPADVTIDCDADETDLTLTGNVNNVTDNCGILDTSYVDNLDGLVGCPMASMTVFNFLVPIAERPSILALNTTGLLVRTWTVTDECGNSLVLDQNITVQDTTPPDIFECISDITVDCDGSLDPSAIGAPMASDNCSPTSTLVYDFVDDGAAGTCADELPIARTWTVTDECGNSSQCEQMITIQDVIKPEFTLPADVTVNCQDDLLNLNLTGNVDDATDNCVLMDISFVDSPSGPLGCSGTGVIERTWTARDLCGNDSIAIQQITVVDEEKPSFTVPADFTIDCESAADVSITGDVTDATDNCDLVSIGFADAVVVGMCENEMTILRTWTAVDLCGNDSVAVQTILVQDETPPSFTVPNDTIINCEVLPIIANTGDVTDESDNCGVNEATFEDSPMELTGCSGTGVIMRTWTLTDNCENSTVQIQMITVQDTTPPDFVVPPSVTINCEDDSEDLNLTGEVSNVIDNCGVIDTSFIDDVSGLTGCSSTGTIVRTWTITDNCNIATSLTQEIVIVDNTPPDFTVPGDITIDCEVMPIVANTGDVIDESDNCVVGEATFVDNPLVLGGCNGTGVIMRTWTLLDDCMNLTEKVQMITVQDTTHPVILTCISDIVVTCDGNLDPSAVGTPTASDNCTLAEDLIFDFIDDSSGGTCAGDSPIIRTWTISDGCGNSSSCTQNITITDNEKPSFTVPADFTIDCEIAADVSVTGDVTDAADNCVLMSIGFEDNVQAGMCENEMTISRTWTAVDLCGNDSIAVQTIFVQDVTPPSFTVPADTIINCEVAPSIANTGDVIDEADNCGVGEATFEDSPLTLTGCNGTGTIIRTWTLIDDCDNMTVQEQTITVQDTTPPSFTAPPEVTVNCEDDIDDLNLTGEVSGVTDNCGLADTSYVDDLTGLTGCSGTGIIVRSWTVSDDCGLTTEMTQMITVVDNTLPTFTVPANITIDCEVTPDVVTTGEVEDEMDNCNVGEATFADDLSGLTGCNGTGVISRTWTLLDECMNMNEQVQLITVQDTTPPDVVFPADISLSCEDDPNNTVVTGVPIYTDNCSGLSDLTESFTDVVDLEGCAGSGTISRTWVVTDLCGNESSQVQIISVDDVTPPEFTIPGDISITCYQDYLDLTITGDVEIVAGACDIGLNRVFSDAVSLDGCNNTGQVVRSWTVSDECGNSDSEDQIIYVIDEEGPVALCLDVTLNILSGDNVSVTLDELDGGSFDCGPISRSADQLFFTCDDAGLNEVQLTFTDACQLESTCISNVTVIDAVLPTISCPADITIELGPAQCEAVATFDLPVGMDNCAFEIVRTDDLGLDSGDEFFAGTNVISYEIIDVSGNIASCSHEVFVKNFPPPAFACLGQINIGLDANCEFTLRPEDVLAGDLSMYGCLDSYEVVVGTGTESNFIPLPTSPVITADYIGQDLIFTITDGTNNLTCWGRILTEDKLGPSITGSAMEVECDQSIDPFELGFPFDPEIGVDSVGGVIVAEQGVDNCTSATITFTDSLSIQNCDSIHSKVIYRKWIATDEFSRVATTYDTISILRPLISELELPRNFDGIDTSFLLCEDRGVKWDTLSNGHPKVEVTGFVGGLTCDQIFTSYEDLRLNNCETSVNSCFKILRTWTILDWCSSAVIEHEQIIKIHDDKAPIVTAPDDQIVDINIWCQGEMTIDVPGITDNCAVVEEYTVKSSSGTITYDNGIYRIADLSLGSHSIIFEAIDCCGNIGVDTMHIDVIDNSPPTAICHEHTVVSLSIDEEADSINTAAKVYATDIDDGSNDNCNEVWVKVKRMDEKFCDAGQPSTMYGDFVQFCCDDVGILTNVILRVFEKDPGTGFIDNSRLLEGGDLYGTYTDCMSVVEVQDKVNPVIVPPTDMTVSCNVWFEDTKLSSFFGGVAANVRTRDSIFILDKACPGDPLFDLEDPNKTYRQFIGLSGYAYDACEVIVTEQYTVERGCDDGYVLRTFTAMDEAGNISTASQRIMIKSCYPFYISDLDCSDDDPFDGVIWPCNFYNEECETMSTDTSVTGVPVFPFNTCQLIGVEYRDIDFESVGDGCYYFLREWRVIDECQFGIDQVDDIHDGEWRYYQEIHVNNTVAPTFVNCDDVTLGQGSECEAVFDFTVQAEDDCTLDEKLQYHYSIDYNNDGTYEETIQSNQIKVILEPGEHKITWAVFDGCVNAAICDQIVTVEDLKAPTPYCYNGLSTSIDHPGEVLEFWASDFDLGSFDDCESAVVASFSSDTSDTRLLVSCNDLDRLPLDTLDVVLWITDEVGNQSTCLSYLIISAKDDACSEQNLIANISGEIYHHASNEMISEVGVSLSSDYMEIDAEQMTASGYFDFDGLRMYEDYQLNPRKDNDITEGVTTLDLVMIQRHILGISMLENPYLLIAADINNSNKITASDLLDLRKVILGMKQNFSNNTSWRFVEDQFEFLIPSAPWIFPESSRIDDLISDVHLSYKGIKVGDVNGSIQLNANNNALRRSINAINLRARHVGDGLSFIVEEDLICFGLQFSLYINDIAELDVISSDLPGFSEENYVIESTAKGFLIRFSWHSQTAIKIEGMQILKIDDVNSHAVSYNLNDAFKNEIYDADLNEIGIRLDDGNKVESGFVLYQNNPNPFFKRTKVTYETFEDQNITMSIMDITGKALEQNSNFYEAGVYEKVFSFENYSPGIYYLRLQSKDQVSSIKMIVLE